MESQNLPVYNLWEAAEVIHSNISEELKVKYAIETIYEVLDLMDDYYDLIGLNIYEGQELPDTESVVVDGDVMIAFILTNALHNGLETTKEDLNEILIVELIYCQQIGIWTDTNNVTNQL